MKTLTIAKTAFTLFMLLSSANGKDESERGACLIKCKVLSYELIDYRNPYSSSHFEKYLTKIEVTEFIKGIPMVTEGEILDVIGYLGPSENLKAESEEEKSRDNFFIFSHRTKDGHSEYFAHSVRYYYPEIYKELIVEPGSSYNSGQSLRD